MKNKNSNNAYDFLNDVDFDLNEYEREDLSEFEKSKIKNNLKNTLKNNKVKNRKKHRIAIAAIISVVSIGGILLSISDADTFNFLDNLAYSISETFSNKEYNTYSNVINRSVSSNGISMKLDDFIAYENRIDTTFLVSGKPGFSYSPNDIEFIINGHVIKPSGSSGNSFSKDGVEYVYMSYTLDKSIDKLLSNKSKIHIKIRSFDEMNDSSSKSKDEYVEISGKWDFRFTENRKMLDSSNVLKENINLSSDKFKAKISTVFIRPTGNIEMIVSDKNISSDYLISVEGVNPSGDKIMLYEYSADKNYSNSIQSGENKVKLNRNNIDDFKFSLYVSKEGRFGNEQNNRIHIGKSFYIK